MVDLQCCVNFSCTVKWFSYTQTHTHTHTHDAFSPSFPLGTAGRWSYLKWVLLHGQGSYLALKHRAIHPEPLHGSWVEFRACLDFVTQAGESAFWHRWFPTAKTFSPAHFYSFSPLNNTFEGIKNFYKILNATSIYSCHTTLAWFPVLYDISSSPSSVQFIQSVSRVQLLATPWTAACQASLSITSSWSLLKLMSIVSVMPSNHLILCLQSFPASGSFPMSQFFASGGQSIGRSASASVLPMNIQYWFPLGWTG